jgi:hypothetical protein
MGSKIVEVHGSFYWTKDPLVFDSEFAGDAGIYLWSVETGSGDLIYYVGETVRFSERLNGHLKSYLRGHYRIYEPDRFIRGEKHLVWPGAWRNSEKHRLIEWEERKDELLPFANAVVDSMRLWLMPLTVGKRLQCRLEGAIARHLRSLNGPAGSFQDDDIRYQRRKKSEEPVTFNIKTPHLLIGLPESIIA